MKLDQFSLPTQLDVFEIWLAEFVAEHFPMLDLNIQVYKHRRRYTLSKQGNNIAELEAFSARDDYLRIRAAQIQPPGGRVNVDGSITDTPYFFESFYRAISIEFGVDLSKIIQNLGLLGLAQFALEGLSDTDQHPQSDKESLRQELIRFGRQALTPVAETKTEQPAPIRELGNSSGLIGEDWRQPSFVPKRERKREEYREKYRIAKLMVLAGKQRRLIADALEVGDRTLSDILKFGEWEARLR